MPFKFNPFTTELDFYQNGVMGISPTTDTAIARWVGTNADTIENSKAYVQDGGAIEAQGFITRKLITDSIQINSNNVMITDGFSLELTGELVIESDGELVIV